jgi:hypothetical protein
MEHGQKNKKSYVMKQGMVEDIARLPPETNNNQPKKCLSGNVGDMLATCLPDSQMSAFLANISLSWQHKTNPDTVFL